MKNYISSLQIDEYLEFIAKLIKSNAKSVDEAVEIVRNAKTNGRGMLQ